VTSKKLNDRTVTHHEQSTSSMAKGKRPLTDLLLQWQQQWGLLHDNEDGEGASLCHNDFSDGLSIATEYQQQQQAQR